MKPITRPMTKSPRRLAREALAVAREALPAFSCRTSRKDFTQHQLFAVLALKTFLKTDYRGVVAFLGDFPYHTTSHLSAAAEVAVGPTTESPLFGHRVGDAMQHAPFDRVLGAAAYDAEHPHADARFYGARSTVIPLNRRGAGRKWPRTR